MYYTSPFSTDRKRFRIARDQEFVELYNSALKLMIQCGVTHPRQAAISFTVNNGHPRYHVSFDRAYVVVCQRLRNNDYNSDNRTTSLRNRMWNEITRRVAELTREQNISIAAALEFVLEHCRASRFFISEQYADTRLDSARAQKRKQLSKHQTQKP